MQQARNVGIHAVEIYFPKTYVCQAELEQFAGVSKGKYTIGLGQTNMAFVQDSEDVNSMALTVVQNLLEKFKIDPRSIGRLEVGTETLLDKSKSTKTVLMQLFAKYGNHDIEGITNINACYGGTSALLNTISWIQSESWDGRLGIVVASDVAVYAKGPARPTGGAGAVAMLVGPDAPIIMENLRCSYLDHTYDFYKPDMNSEFPTVEGQVSIASYSKAISNCYLGLKQKLKNQRGEDFNLDSVDYCCFHTPFCKQVTKGFNMLFDLDMKANAISGKNMNSEIQTLLSEHKKQPLDPKVAQKAFKAYWDTKVQPSLHFATHLGNIYTGSLYAGLVSLISDPSINLENKRIMMFSYGSGLASTMFVLKFDSDVRVIREKMQARERLQSRTKIPCEVYDRIMEDKKNKYNKVPFKPEVQLDLLFDGTYYLESADEKYKRNYLRKTAHQPVLKTNPVSSIELKEDPTGLRRIKTLRGHLTQASETEEVGNKLLWTGFHKKTFKERLDHLKKLDHSLNTDAYETGGLSLPIADIMVENCVGKLSLPMGLGLNFQINSKFYTVPMVVEEPSVIAACSAAAKFISENGEGFTAHATDSIMRGQIQILDCDCQTAVFVIEQSQKEIIDYANQACQSMVSRGGGVVRIIPKIVPCGDDLKMIDSNASDMLIVEVLINVCESMGANIINTVVEHTSPFVADLVGGRPGIKILTNLCTERRAFAKFEIPIEKMKWKNASGEEVAKRMIEAYLFAKHDIYRAVTHNKGIMNGIDAVAIATGQDWRAIEAAAHTYSELKHGKYQPLTQYHIKKNKDGQVCFTGSIEFPISLGTVGGVVQNNQVYSNNMKMLGYPNSKELSQIFVCVGLANNFAALRALAIEGIQKGHMSLHAKNIALSAGVPHYLAMDAVEFMKSIGRISKDSAKAYMGAIDLYAELRTEIPREQEKQPVRPLSTFFLEILVDSLSEPIILNIALDCYTKKAIHLAIEKNPKTKRTPEDISIQNKLFGDKGYQWLSSFFVELDLIKFSSVMDHVPGSNTSKSQELCYKLKTLAILINILSLNLIKMDYAKVRKAYEIIKVNPNSEDLEKLLNGGDVTLKYGCFLLAEMIKIVQYNLELIIPFPQLKSVLLKEMFAIIDSHFVVYEMWNDAIRHKKFDFERFFTNRRKRLCATMMLYCDALILKNDLSENIINKMKVLGEIYEIEGTMARDLARWSAGETETNVYTYWLLWKNMPQYGAQEKIKQQFIKMIMPISNKKKEQLDSTLIDQYEVTRCVIQSHYGVNDKVLPPSDIEPKL